MVKTYEVRGMMEWHPVFVAGRARIQVSFTGGHLGEGCVTPARYETSDEVVQTVIETSVAFKSGRIRLSPLSLAQPSNRLGMAQAASAADNRLSMAPAASAAEISKAQPASVASSNPQANPSLFDTFEFESIDEVRTFLNIEKGISKSRLHTEADLVREANNLHFNFRIKQ